MAHRLVRASGVVGEADYCFGHLEDVGLEHGLVQGEGNGMLVDQDGGERFSLSEDGTVGGADLNAGGVLKLVSVV